LLVPVDDADALAAALSSVLVEPTTERTTIARARFLEHYTIERVAAEMVAFYARATGP
jgi:glycosyltransferase involved in cell wall biosynthesis